MSYDNMLVERLREQLEREKFWLPKEKSCLLKSISLNENLTNDKKIKILNSASVYWRSRDLSNDYSGSLRQSLYNVIDMLNKDSEVILTKSALASYKNLVRDNYAYLGRKKVKGLIEDSELGTIEVDRVVNYLRLTPLGILKAKSMKSIGLNLATKEMKRLKRLGLS